MTKRLTARQVDLIDEILRRDCRDLARLGPLAAGGALSVSDRAMLSDIVKDALGKARRGVNSAGPAMVAELQAVLDALALRFACPVCGFADLRNSPYGERGDRCSYELCDCCGFQFGVTDGDRHLSFEQWRSDWVAQGMPWRSIGRPSPEHWDPAAAVARLRTTES